MEPDLEAALQRLPHGPEFRFLDRLTHLDPGRQGRAEYTVPRECDCSFLRGHFPGQPLFPGVLLIEAAAQLAGVVAQSDPQVAPLEDLRLTALRQVKILGAARPGRCLTFEATITGRLGNLIQATTEASLDGVRILHAQVTLSGRAPSA